MAQTMGGSRLESIEALRGFAIALVLLAHLPFSNVGLNSIQGTATSTFPPAPYSEWMAAGQYGVQLFLVVSGFCIHLRWAQQGYLDRGVEFGPFWKRRLVRLMPPYLLVMTGSFLLVFAAGLYPGHSIADVLWDLLALLTFTQNLTEAPWRIGNGPLWSLALEEQLYLLYFPLLWLRRRAGWARTLGLLLATTLSSLFLAGRWPPAAPLANAGPAYWFPWALGAAAVEAHYGLIRMPAWTSSLWPALTGLLVGYCLPTPFREFSVTCAFFFVLRAGLKWESGFASRPGWTKIFVKLGTISYSLYLVHQPVYVVSKRLMAGHLPQECLLFLRPCLALLVAWGFYRAVELPCLRLSKRVVGGRVAPIMHECDPARLET